MYVLNKNKMSLDVPGKFKTRFSNIIQGNFVNLLN